jgi:hypothetical protein
VAYSEQDRTLIRHFVGYGAVWLQAEPRLENALIATQSLADGGGRPDSNTENFIKGLIYGTLAQAGTPVTPGPTTQSVAFAMPATIGLLAIEQKIANLWDIAFIMSADNRDAVIDVPRAIALLRKEGRRLAHSLARMMGMRGVRADVFASSPIIVDDDPFSYSDLEHWRRGP